MKYSIKVRDEDTTPEIEASLHKTGSGNLMLVGKDKTGRENTILYLLTDGTIHLTHDIQLYGLQLNPNTKQIIISDKIT